MHHPPNPPTTAEVASDREAELYDYLAIIWDHRIAILTIATVCAMFFVVVDLFRPQMYAASARLLLTPARSGAEASAPMAVAQHNVASLVAGTAVSAQLTKELGLPKDGVSISSGEELRKRVRVTIQEGTSVIDVTVRLRNPELAATAANRFAEEAVALSRELRRREFSETRDFLKTQVDLAKQRMDDAEQGLLLHRQASQIDLRKSDAEAMLAERGTLLKLAVELASEKSRLARAELELRAREPVIVTQRSIDQDPALTEAARGTGRTGAALLGLKLRDEELNPVYSALDEEVAVSHAKVAALQRSWAELVDRRKLNSKQSLSMSEYYERLLIDQRLDDALKLERKVYGELFVQYEHAVVQVASQSPDLQVIDRAGVPSQPVWAARLLTPLLAFLTAALAGALCALLYEYVRGVATLRA